MRQNINTKANSLNGLMLNRFPWCFAAIVTNFTSFSNIASDFTQMKHAHDVSKSYFHSLVNEFYAFCFAFFAYFWVTKFVLLRSVVHAAFTMTSQWLLKTSPKIYGLLLFWHMCNRHNRLHYALLIFSIKQSRGEKGYLVHLYSLAFISRCYLNKSWTFLKSSFRSIT